MTPWKPLPRLDADDVHALAVSNMRREHLSPAFGASAPLATFTSRRTRVGGTPAFL